MIVLDLACSSGHVFEAWFGSRDAYEGQRERGLVICAICGEAAIGTVPVAPRIAGTGDRGTEPQRRMRALAALQAHMLAGSEHVGARFATEARAIHQGDAEERPIHGCATLAEAKALVADGVLVAPLPLPVRDPGREH